VARAFLGLASYYRRFVKGYGDVAAPLTQLLRKEGFQWCAEAEAAFRALQRALTSAPVLQLPDFTTDFVVECDASSTSVGRVLHQGDEPIAYFSRQLAPRHAKLVAYKRELIGLIQAMRHWRPYLWGRAFVIKMDHFSLKFLLDQRLSTIPQHQWSSKLIGFDFQVEYKPGVSNIIIDALSRCDTEATTEVAALSGPAFDIFDALRAEAMSSAEMQQLRDEVTSGARGERWDVINGLFMHKGRIYVSPQSPSLPEILATAHGLGHEGMEETHHRL
jgi:hypothetical protein